MRGGLGQSRAAALLLAAVLAGGVPSGPARAQDGLGVVQPGGGLRPFARPLHWRNLGPDDRIPIHERPLPRRPGLVALSPVPDQRRGLTPSVGAALVYENSSQPGADPEVFPVLSLGLSYKRDWQRLQLAADYTVEVSLEEGSLSPIDTHGGALSLGYTLSERDALSFSASHSTSGVTEAAPVQGAVAQASRIDISNALLGYTRQVTPRTGYALSLGGLRQATDQPGAPDVLSAEIGAEAWHFLSETRRIDGELRLAHVDFEGPSDNRVFARLRYTADLGPRLAASGHATLLHTGEGSGRAYGGVGGHISTSWKNALFTLEMDRDLLTVPGIGGLVLTDRVGAQVEARFDRGLLGRFTVEQQFLETLRTGDKTQVTAFEGELTYAMSRQLWLWGRVRLSHESSTGSSRDDAQISVGVTRNLRDLRLRRQ